MNLGEESIFQFTILVQSEYLRRMVDIFRGDWENIWQNLYKIILRSHVHSWLSKPCFVVSVFIFSFVRATTEAVWRSLQSLESVILKNEPGGFWSLEIWHLFSLFSTLYTKMFKTTNSKWQSLCLLSTHVNAVWEQQVVFGCWYFLSVRVFQTRRSDYSIKRELLSRRLLVTVSCSQQ